MLESNMLGPALRLLRSQRQLKQKEVALRAGITPSMLSGYETGRRMPSLVTIDRVLEALGGTLTDLTQAASWLATAAPRLDAAEDSWPFGARDDPKLVESASSSADLADLGAALEVLLGPAELESMEEEQRASMLQMLAGYRCWLRFLATLAKRPE